jgi:hypothetical protein
MRGELYFVDDRMKLNEGLRERGYRPHATFPGDCFIVESAGLPMEDIPVEESVGWTGYFSFVWRLETNDDGKKIKYKVLDTHDMIPLRVWREYTTDQAKVIHQYWELLSDDVRYIKDGN